MTDHVVAIDDGDPKIMRLHCEHCGADLRIKLPVSIDEMCAATDAFVARHKDCKPAEKA